MCIYLYTVEPAITATLYNGHLSIAVTIEQSRPKFHNIDPVYSGHLLNAASGHPFAALTDPKTVYNGHHLSIMVTTCL